MSQKPSTKCDHCHKRRARYEIQLRGQPRRLCAECEDQLLFSRQIAQNPIREDIEFHGAYQA